LAGSEVQRPVSTKLTRKVSWQRSGNLKESGSRLEESRSLLETEKICSFKLLSLIAEIAILPQLAKSQHMGFSETGRAVMTLPWMSDEWSGGRRSLFKFFADLLSKLGRILVSVYLDPVLNGGLKQLFLGVRR
jgi:hypothetical protein